MRALVTGAGGFAGRHAVERLRAAGVETFAFEGDIRDAEACLGQVRASRPDAVLHLAAISSVADAWRRPDVVTDVNVGGTRNLLGAVAAAAPAARFVLVSSAEVYGAVAEADQPIGEDAPLRPISPYASSKLEAEAVAHASSVETVIARPFPHIGPGQDDAVRDRVVRPPDRDDRARRRSPGPARRQPRGAPRPLGRALHRRCVPRPARLPDASGTYNVSTGRAERVGDVLDALLRLSEREIEIAEDPDRLRPADIPLLCGDPARIAHDLGWRANRPLEQTLLDTLTFFRERLA